MYKHKVRVLFLCTGNSCRSQMAEGWANHLGSEWLEATSAGIEAHGKNPRAITVMREAGVDISHQESTRVTPAMLAWVDLVVTVCGHAHETCPVFPGGKTKVVHVGFEDPPELEKSASSPEEALGHYRRVRDEIRDFIAGLPGSLPA